MKIDHQLQTSSLGPALTRTFELAQQKVRLIDKLWNPKDGTPVFTIEGKYTSRGWTEWTQGFQYGCAILTFDATDDRELFKLGRSRTTERMAHHVSHIGVHDHGFTNLSTYGNLRRLMREGRTPANEWEKAYYEMALKVSGAVQASRWQGAHPARDNVGKKRTADAPQLGYVYSFNGPHSLFIDTMRTTRSLGVAWQLGHPLMHEGDKAADLLKRLVLHGLATNHYIVFHGDSGETYDVRGRTAHEGTFNRNDGQFRSRATQQGYSPFSTWTRGLAWAMLGYAEELEFFRGIDDAKFETSVGLKKADVVAAYEQGAIDTCDHYINDVAASDGITYWDDGAPNLHKLGDWRAKPSDPYNDHEPVDASASAIAAQGLLRLGNYLGGEQGRHYTQAGLTVTKTLLAEPYLSTSADHEGLLLHSIYHQPNGWDHVPKGRSVASGESSLWGDYHLLELCVYLKRIIESGPYLTFFG